MRKALAVTLAMLASASPGLAAEDPMLGVWTLDVGRSVTTGPFPILELRTYRPLGDDGVTLIVEGVDAYGKDYAYGASGELDGRSWPVASRDVGARILGDAIAWRRVDAHTVEMQIKKKDAVLNTTRHTISADARTLTVTENGVDADNRPIHDTRVYTRAPERGVATDIPKADVDALAKTMLSLPGGDQLLRVVPINGGEYNVGVAVVHRAKAANIEAALDHSEITEIYHIISGSGTMVSGGSMANPRNQTPVNPVIGPSFAGGKITGGESRKVGAGDVIIVPPNTPHGWSEVSEELIYLVVRIDPKKVLPLK